MPVGPDVLAKIIDSQWGHICIRYNSYQIRTLNAIRRCRTPALGGSLYLCDHCGQYHKRYHSCRNRHCSQCQNTQKEVWIAKQKDKLIDSKYYHVVFTIPHDLNDLLMNYPRQMYATLMRISWQTLDAFGWNHKYLGAQLGCTMLLHTWGSNLSYHPHVHCIVPGGGIDLKGKWRTVKGKGKFLFPVKALSKVFRGKMMAELKVFLDNEGMEFPQELQNKLYTKPWVVYAKPPFGGAQGVIKYLARYASKIAITHHRIKHFDKYSVQFSYTDYRHANQSKLQTLSLQEFIRRFTMHILPKGFCKIRHFGILSGAWKSRVFPDIVSVNQTAEIVWLAKGIDINQCNKCKIGKLIFLSEIAPVRGPPLPIKFIKVKADI